MFRRSREEYSNPILFITWEEIRTNFMDYKHVEGLLNDMDIFMPTDEPMVVTPTVNIYKHGLRGFRSKSDDCLILFRVGSKYKVLGITDRVDGAPLTFMLQPESEKDVSPMWLDKRCMRYIADADILGAKSLIIDEPDPVTDQISWAHWFISSHKNASVRETQKEWIVACAAAIHGEHTPSKGMRNAARKDMMGRSGFPPFISPFGPFGPFCGYY